MRTGEKLGCGMRQKISSPFHTSKYLWYSDNCDPYSKLSLKCMYGCMSACMYVCMCVCSI